MATQTGYSVRRVETHHTILDVARKYTSSLEHPRARTLMIILRQEYKIRIYPKAKTHELYHLRMASRY